MSNLNQINEVRDISSECDENLNNLECKIDSKLVDVTDYFSYEKDWNAYYAVVDWLKLDIPLYSQEQLVKTLNEIRILLMTDSELTLSWDRHMRYIEKDLNIFSKVSNLIDSWELGNILIEAWSNRDDKNYVEEIFEFVMSVKWIPKQDWNIWWEICKSDKESCIAELWNSRVDYSTMENNTLLARE